MDDDGMEEGKQSRKNTPATLPGCFLYLYTLSISIHSIFLLLVLVLFFHATFSFRVV